MAPFARYGVFNSHWICSRRSFFNEIIRVSARRDGEAFDPSCFTWWGRCSGAGLPSGRSPTPSSRRSSSWGCSRSWWWRPAAYWACSLDSAAPAEWTAAPCVYACTLARWGGGRNFIPPLTPFKKINTTLNPSCRKWLLATWAHKVESFYTYFSKDHLVVQQRFLWSGIPLCLWNMDSFQCDGLFV